MPADRPVKIRWTCPCGHRNRWKWERDDFDLIPCSRMDCDECGRSPKVEVVKVVYRVVA